MSAEFSAGTMPRCSRYRRDSSAGRSAKIMIALLSKYGGIVVMWCSGVF